MGAVAAPHHEVVDVGLDRAVDAVHVADDLGVRPHAQRRGAAGGSASAGVRPRGEVAAGPGIGDMRAVRRRGGLADLRARAPALVAGGRRCAVARRPRRRAPIARTGDDAPSQSIPSARRSASCWSTYCSRERPGSRSSTRIRKRAPAPRANSQASSAVRRLPRCSVARRAGRKAPVGARRRRACETKWLAHRRDATSARLARSRPARLYGAAAMAEPDATEEAEESAPPLPCAPCRGKGTG